MLARQVFQILLKEENLCNTAIILLVQVIPLLQEVTKSQQVSSSRSTVDWMGFLLG